MLASLIFSNRDWLVPVCAALGVALVFLVLGYRKSPAALSLRVLCFTLKLLGLAALGLCLLEPMWTGERAKRGANLFVIVADNSLGMQIKDRGAERSRGELLRDLVIADKAAWQAKLDENFQVRRYVFDARLQPTDNFSELVFDGRASAIGAALKTIGERYKGRPLAGVLLLTDGNATDLIGVPDLASLPPIFPVVIGTDDPIKDIAIAKVAVSQTAFEDAPVTVQADVTATGYAGASIVARLLDLTGKVVEEQTLRAQQDGDTLAFRFQLKPVQAGLSFYRLRVAAKDEFEQFTNPKLSTEATLANNSRVLAVDRGRGPYRILYVSGRPNWEFKFLNRALAEDDQVQLVALIRVAKREPKFAFKGRFGESSNPLFRGFGTPSSDEVQRYDQPVLTRLNTRDQEELRGGFPKTPEELYGYHAVIIDDLEAEFFTTEQHALLQKYVSERGGGLLMLGGMESFQQGRYQRTPVGDMLPIYLDRGVDSDPPAQVRMSLTREGWLQPWTRLRSNEADEKARLEAMPPFLVVNPARDVKPGASVVATVSDGHGKELPALVTQRFGHGRTMALLIGDLWHWGLHDADAHKDMDKSWRQTIRALIVDVPQRVELTATEQRAEPGQPLLLQARVRDAKFQPLDNAAVTLKIQTLLGEGKAATTNVIHLHAEPSLAEPGLYTASYVPRETGGYRAEAFVTNSVGAEVGRAETGWTSDPAAEEFRSLKPNRALLADIAKKTGGEVIAASRLDEFARSLPQRSAPVTEPWTYPLWHTPAVFAFALACFLAEWGLRRWKGLA